MVRERWKQFARLFRPRMDSLVGVDFGNGLIKIAEVTNVNDKTYLRTMTIVEDGGELGGVAETESTPETKVFYNTDMLTDRLQRALSLSGVRSKNVVLALGGQMTFVREVTFPNMPREELSEAIKWEMPKYVPYEEDSYEYDFAITGQDIQNGDLRILLVAAPKTVVCQLTQVIRQAGLIPLAIEIEPLAIYRTMSGGDNSILVDVGTVNTQISLFQHGKPVFTRLVPVGGICLSKDLGTAAGAKNGESTELEDFVAELGQEVQRSSQFHNLQKKQGRIDKVFVTGTNELASLVRQLAAKIDLPVIGHNPLATMAINPSISASHVRKMGPQMAVAVGLAMRGNEP